MANYTRLFEIFSYQLKNNPKEDSLCYKYNGAWRKYSTQEVVDTIDACSLAFLKLGLQPGDKVAIVCPNRPEWNFIDNGMMQVGIVNVPIYPTSSENDYAFILNDAEVKYVFVSDKMLYRRINNVRDRVPSLREIYSIEEVEGCKNFTTDFLPLADTADLPKVKSIADTINPHDLATIIYTSGTTGNPKGVMLSHNNVVSNIDACIPEFPVDNTMTTLSFLPLCHIFERTVTYAYFAIGCSVYYAESLERVADNLKEVRPHFFTTVPRLLEKVYEKLVSKGMELEGFKKKLYFWAMDLASTYKEDQSGNIKTWIADKLIYSKWREALGGRLVGIVTGAAALQERLARVFSAAGIPIREGYGQTETSPVVSFNRFSKGGFKFGSIGMVIKDVEVKLDHREGMKDGEGELLVKGPNVMLGYYKQPELTAGVMKDGWLCTGDVAAWVDGEFLKITDRVKELFKTSGGKYVAPGVVENKMKECRFIEQIMVVGENQKFVAALIVPSFLNLKEWAKQNNVSYNSNEDLVANQTVKKMVFSEVEKLNEGFGQIEKVKRIELLPNEWSVDGGELTPTMKVKRKVVAEKYKANIEKLFC